MYKVSVIIPVYSVEKYIVKCIESVINQTYKYLQIILVDDGSPDKCGDICDEYARKDNRIKVIHQSNGGLSDARNAGLLIADGDYITLLDSDDYWQSTYVENSLHYITQNDADMVIFPLCSFNENGRILKKRDSREQLTMNAEEALRKMFSSSVPWCAQGKLYRKELFCGIQYPKGKLMEDKATTYKIFEKCTKILFVECSDYMYLVREGSIMHSSFNSKHLHTLEIQEEMNEHICTSFPMLNDVVLGYSSRVYLTTLYTMIAASYDDISVIQNTIYGWYKDHILLSKSNEIDYRYKLLSKLTLCFYAIYRNEMYKSMSFKYLCKIISKVLLNK